ncbi:MAG: NUDIX domain-containing protein [Campylobacterota bacterium]
MENRVEEFKVNDLNSTKFVEPLKLSYILNGVNKQWEAVRSFDSVAVLLYHIEKDSFILVKQFRPPVYLNDKSKLCTYELCAGIVDKDLSLEQIVKEEIDEECGYDVKLENIEKVTSFYTNVGVSGAKQSLYFAKVSQADCKHSGGGVNDEQIELMYLPLEQMEEFLFDESKAKTPGLMFSFYWFLKNRYV